MDFLITDDIMGYTQKRLKFTGFCETISTAVSWY